jgi:hypothetical protein
MPSPFPGMDPYLEGSLWPDVHATLIPLIREAVVAALPAGYVANIDHYVWLGEGEDSEPIRRGKPDAFFSEGPGRRQRGTPAMVVAEPTTQVQLSTPRRVRRKRYIRLLDAEDRRVVTVIELLSPSDKLPKHDRDRYVLKREEYLAAGANLVEIDLLRRGLRVPMGDSDIPEADYYLLVSRAAEYPAADVWAFTVRDAIPIFPVPLKPQDPPVPLDLRKCLDRAYDGAGYEDQIAYADPATPPLRGPDATWATELLRKPAAKKSRTPRT